MKEMLGKMTAEFAQEFCIFKGEKDAPYGMCENPQCHHPRVRNFYILMNREGEFRQIGPFCYARWRYIHTLPFTLKSRGIYSHYRTYPKEKRTAFSVKVTYPRKVFRNTKEAKLWLKKTKYNGYLFGLFKEKRGKQENLVWLFFMNEHSIRKQGWVQLLENRGSVTFPPEEIDLRG